MECTWPKRSILITSLPFSGACAVSFRLLLSVGNLILFVGTSNQYLYVSEPAVSTCLCQSRRPVPVFVRAGGQYLYLS